MIKSHELSFDYTRYEEDGTKISLTALKGIDIAITEGEFVAILGHNGSGKSTLAKHLNALFLPSDGVLWVDNYDTGDESFIWDIRKSVGMVFQNPDNQIIATVVEEDVAFGPENIGIPSEEIRHRVDSALSAVRMQDYAKHAPNMLSGGQKQRIAIAGILAMKPKYIVLDEPTAMLDPVGRREVMETILRLNKDEGITVILITHFVEEAANADRVIIMDDGKIVLDGLPSDVLTNSVAMEQYALEVPLAVAVSQLLNNRFGIELPSEILTLADLVGALCDYRSKI